MSNNWSFPFTERIQQAFWPIFLVGILSACIPSKETFFTPSARGGQTQGNTCNGHAGILNVIEFPREEVRIFVSVISEKKLVLTRFQFTAPASISVPADEFTLQTKKKSKILRLSKLTMYQYSNTPPLVKKTDLHIEHQLLLKGNKRTSIHLTFPADWGQNEKFTLLLPQIQINHQKVTIPSITWALTRDWIYWPLNC